MTLTTIIHSTVFIQFVYFFSCISLDEIQKKKKPILQICSIRINYQLNHFIAASNFKSLVYSHTKYLDNNYRCFSVRKVHSFNFIEIKFKWFVSIIEITERNFGICVFKLALFDTFPSLLNCWLIIIWCPYMLTNDSEMCLC